MKIENFLCCVQLQVASVRVCECASVRVCECASVRVCECASVRVCECASVRVWVALMSVENGKAVPNLPSLNALIARTSMSETESLIVSWG
jgi:hypothetical protein